VTTKGKTRINLRVYARIPELVYHVLHVGFFPSKCTTDIVAGLDARSLAFAMNPPAACGLVEVVTADMRHPDREIVALALDYQPRSHRELQETV
jgi:hypothetical protein